MKRMLAGLVGVVMAFGTTVEASADYAQRDDTPGFVQVWEDDGSFALITGAKYRRTPVTTWTLARNRARSEVQLSVVLDDSRVQTTPEVTARVFVDEDGSLAIQWRVRDGHANVVTGD